MINRRYGDLAERLDQLDVLAAAATPGPFRIGVENGATTLAARDFSSHIECDSPEDAAFIAAADPDTVRALTAVARAARNIREHPIDTWDRPQSWQAQADLMDALEALS